MQPTMPGPCRLVLLHYDGRYDQSARALVRISIPAVVVRAHDDGTVDLHPLPGPDDFTPDTSHLRHVRHAPMVDGVANVDADARPSWWTWPPRT